MDNRPTMRDVAKATGFSINTVSRALSHKPDVSEETREAIVEAATKMDYRPNKLARSLRSNKTYTIGVIVADIANPYFGALVKGVEKEARKRHYSVILLNTDEDYERETEAIQVVLEEHVDGIIISPTQKEKETITNLLQLGIPFVLFGRRFSDLATNYVVTDDVHGGFLATEHLILLGHRQIAMINGPLHISSAKERFQGYREALERYGLKQDQPLVTAGAVTMEDGYEVAKSLLNQNPRPTAIFAFSDFVSFGVMKAIREAGLKVPEDISVVGYDDNQFASCSEIPLTTVRVPKEELGISAAKVLKEQLADNQPIKQVELPVDLIVRQSTSSCNT
ncbi:LacI family DNA-binding transcriptional regulator [Candidatus Bipolaricaulota bacterium]|nr:LacI family DNA-binding transcriptional regulator [Candidatus Bipolaricaulota bacterium]